MSNELTAAQAVERLNRARTFIAGSPHASLSIDQMVSILCEGVPLLTPFTPAESCDDILREIGHPGMILKCGVLPGSDLYWRAGHTEDEQQERYATPLEALRALRERLKPADPVPLTEADVEDLDKLVGKTIANGGLEAAALRGAIRARLMRHVAK